jgi:hypothetical protein
MTIHPVEYAQIIPVGFVPFVGQPHTNGLPDGVHCGVWLSPDHQEAWKPLDGILGPDDHRRLDTDELTVLELMADKPGFPRNWRVETFQGRRFLVRQKAWSVADLREHGAPFKREWIEAVETGLRQLNHAGWILNEHLTVLIDRDYQPFIADLSTAMRYPHETDEQRLYRWIKALLPEWQGFVDWRRLAHEQIDSVKWAREYGLGEWYVYASRNRPISRMRASGLPDDCVIVSGDGKPHTWVMRKGPLTDDVVHSYELTVGWQPYYSRKGE